jgi:hypothetical protein
MMGIPLKIDPVLLDYCTPRQREILEAIDRLGSAKLASIELGLAISGASNTYNDVRIKAAKQGYSPAHDMTNTVPAGFNVKGVSTYYDLVTGKPRGQWVKSTADQAAREEMQRAALAALAEDLPRAMPVPPPSTGTNASLLNLYTITDYHIGMLAWHREGGDDWDLAIAERTLTGCFEAMVAGAPPAAGCVINQLGDFLHYDGMTAETPTSGHPLDADGRFTKMVEIAVRVLRRLVEHALTRHQTVHVIMAEGNHDLASSVWLRTLFAALYENEPRVTVDGSALPYYAMRHGSTMLAFHHGHLSKNDSLPLLFASQFSKMWGDTARRYAHTGHRHHLEEKEHSGMIVTQHPTLAARDAYAARGGWIAQRAATAITYHDRHGKVATNSVCPEMLEKVG